jgi:uncharacterized protein DUF4406
MLIYTAGPYSSDTEKGIEENINIARSIAATLWESGHAVICPHANTARFETICQATYDQYIEGDLKIVARCDALVMLPGWELSKGANIEREYAQSLDIPIYIYPDLPALHLTEVQSPEQVKGFAEILGKMYRLHLLKNADYSSANILATGEVGLVTRLWDKIARLMNLTGFKFQIVPDTTKFTTPNKPKFESINDTLLDAAVYAIIGLLLRKGVWGR